MPSATALLAAAALLALSSAAAIPTRDLSSMNTDDVVCRYTVKKNIDANRVPKVVKIIKCEDSYKEDCVELQDRVMVFNRTAGNWYVEQFSVACVYARTSGTVAASHKTNA